MDERIARLSAMKCKGRMHAGIRDALLRREFARELNDWRNQALRGGFRLSDEGKKMLHEYSSSLYNGFWAMQKAVAREYVDNGRRAVWALVDAPEPDKNYLEYENKVVELFNEFDAMKAQARTKVGGLTALFAERTKRLTELQVRYGV